MTDDEALAILDAEIRAVDKRAAERAELRELLRPRVRLVDWVIASTITLGSALATAWLLR